MPYVNNIWIGDGWNPSHEIPRINEWLRGLERWAEINGFRRSDAEFGLGALVHGDKSSAKWGQPFQYPACRHPTYYRRGRRPVAIVVEPYDDGDVALLRALAGERGFAFHVPPNPQASLWCAPSTHFVVLTEMGFGPLRWLPFQRE